MALRVEVEETIVLNGAGPGFIPRPRQAILVRGRDHTGGGDEHLADTGGVYDRRVG